MQEVAGPFDAVQLEAGRKVRLVHRDVVQTRVHASVECSCERELFNRGFKIVVGVASGVFRPQAGGVVPVYPPSTH